MSREMRIKWHGLLSKPRKMPGSGAMGSQIGNLEFDSQTNHNADSVPEDDRFKFVDDLTCLEIINLINIGLASHNCKQQVPNDISTDSLIIPNSSLKSQQYINEINAWTKNREMLISERKKTKSMIVNFTKNHQFHTRLQLNDKNIEIVKKNEDFGHHFT